MCTCICIVLFAFPCVGKAADRQIYFGHGGEIIYTCMYTCVCIYKYVYIYMYINTYIYIYI